MAHWDAGSAAHVLALLFDGSVRAVLLAALCWAVIWILRIRSACVVHAIWTAMLAAMILMPLLRTALPRLPVAALPSGTSLVNQAPASEAAQFGQARQYRGDSDEVDAPVDAGQRTRRRWPLLALIVYMGVALALLARQGAGFYITWKLIRGSRQVRPGELPSVAREALSQRQIRLRLRESSRVSVPVTVGFFRPAVILPPEWRASAPRRHSYICGSGLERRRARGVQAETWHSPQGNVGHYSSR